MKEISYQFQISNFKYPIIGLILVILLQVFLLSKLIFFPYPELFVYPYLTNHGMLPYKQIFDQHFPGLLFLPVNFGTLGLLDSFDARVWQYGLVVVTQCLLFFVSTQLFKNKTNALFVCILYLAWQPFLQGWILWINNFLPCLYLLTFYYAFLVVDHSKNLWRNLFLTGLFFGITVVFKQVALPVAGLTFLLLFFLQRSFKTWFYYGLGFFIPVLGMLGWLWWIGVLKDFWFWTIQFNLTTYAKMGGKSPTLGEFSRLLLVYIPSIAIFLKPQSWKVVALLSIFAFGGMFGGGHRFDLTYFQPSLPFVCIAAVLGFETIARKFGKFGLLGTFGYFLVAVIFLVQFYRHNESPYVYYFDVETVKVASIIKSITVPGEEIFIFGSTPLLYQMTETLPAGKIFVFHFPWFLVESEERIYEGLVKSNPRIVVSDPSTKTDNQKITNFAPKLYNYIYSNYHLTDKVGTIEILERNR